MAKPNSREMNVKRQEILMYAKDHGWVINPSKGMEQYVQNWFEFGHCPCDDTRLMCPCEQAEEEVAKDGYCRCRLYWQDLETFRATLPLPSDPRPEDEDELSDEIQDFLKRSKE